MAIFCCLRHVSRYFSFQIDSRLLLIVHSGFKCKLFFVDRMLSTSFLKKVNCTGGKHGIHKGNDFKMQVVVESKFYQSVDSAIFYKAVYNNFPSIIR